MAQGSRRHQGKYTCFGRKQTFMSAFYSMFMYFILQLWDYCVWVCSRHANTPSSIWWHFANKRWYSYLIYPTKWYLPFPPGIPPFCIIWWCYWTKEMRNLSKSMYRHWNLPVRNDWGVVCAKRFELEVPPPGNLTIFATKEEMGLVWLAGNNYLRTSQEICIKCSCPDEFSVLVS